MILPLFCDDNTYCWAEQKNLYSYNFINIKLILERPFVKRWSLIDHVRWTINPRTITSKINKTLNNHSQDVRSSNDQSKNEQNLVYFFAT